MLCNAEGRKGPPEIGHGLLAALSGRYMLCNCNLDPAGLPSLLRGLPALKTSPCTAEVKLCRVASNQAERTGLFLAESS